MDYIVWATLAYLIMDKIYTSKKLIKIEEALMIIAKAIDKINQS